jgi:hypothetical protein
MRLPRPYIPRALRRQVAERQGLTTTVGMHLDHDPPLAVRKKIHNRHGEIIGYDPPANSPEHLIYRKASDHRIKTYTRGEGAQYPDRVLIKKIRRIEHPKPKRKYKWAKRRFGQ